MKEVVPEIEYDAVSRILGKVEKKDMKERAAWRCVPAGTADVPVAEEAAPDGEYFGCEVDRILDGRGGNPPPVVTEGSTQRRQTATQWWPEMEALRFRHQWLRKRSFQGVSAPDRC